MIRDGYIFYLWGFFFCLCFAKTVFMGKINKEVKICFLLLTNVGAANYCWKMNISIFV